MSTDIEIAAWQKELDIVEGDVMFEGDGVHLCSDGREVNVRTSGKNIRVRMDGLEGDEIDSVIETGKEYRKVLSKRTVLRRRVQGIDLFIKNQHWSKALARSEELLALFGKYYNGVEVHRIVTTEWKLPQVKYEFIIKFSRDNSEKIVELKDAYMKDTNNVRLVHKRSRLDELTEMYQSRKMKYETTETRSDYELMLKTLEQIRKEVEGQQIHINGRIQIEHEAAVQDHVNREIMNNLNVNDLIIGRLCARLGVNPKYILYRLHTSYYKKFTGFLPDEMNDDNEVHYPSQVVYDFTRIASLNRSLDVEDVEYKEVPEVKDPVKINKLKEMMKAKMLQKMRDLKDKKNNSDGIQGK